MELGWAEGSQRTGLSHVSFSFHLSAEKFRQRSSASPQLFLTIPESQALNVHVYKRTHAIPQSIRQVAAFVQKSVLCGGGCGHGE